MSRWLSLAHCYGKREDIVGIIYAVTVCVLRGICTRPCFEWMSVSQVLERGYYQSQQAEWRQSLVLIYHNGACMMGTAVIGAQSTTMHHGLVQVLLFFSQLDPISCSFPQYPFHGNITQEPASKTKMTDCLDDRPQAVLYKERTSETARRKKRKFPQMRWRGGGFPAHATVDSAQESIPDPASVKHHMQSLSHEDRHRFEAVIANALNLIQSQQYHIEFISSYSPGFDIRNDDICRYGISLEQESKLRELEIRRLATAILTDISRSPFGSLANEFWRPDDAGFESLSRLADEINMNIATCNLDNSSLRLLRDAEGKMYVSSDDERGILKGCRKRLHSDNTADASSTKTKVTSERTRRCYCALIDYVTAVAARCACHNASGWHSLVVASLATCAAKMKFLAIDSIHFAHQSLAMDEYLSDYGNKLGVRDVRNEAKLSESYKMSSWAFDIIF